MKHILLLGALFLFGATASAQSCTGGDKAKTECTKSKSSCCQGKADAGKSCCAAKSSSCTDSKKGKKSKAKKGGKEQSKPQAALTRNDEKATKEEKKAELSPAKGS